MEKKIDRQIRDSEADTINTTYWRVEPFFRMIKQGKTKELMDSLDLNVFDVDFHERIGKDKKKEIEYMTVSVINTFMIAAIQGGVYPPDANRIADVALTRLVSLKKLVEIPDIIKEAGYDFCKAVEKASKEKIDNRHVENAIHYIRDHLTQKFTVGDIAKNTGISSYYLCHIFKEETGKTITEYIRDKRIEAASELLLNSNHSIAYIATLFQFCDQSYFVSVFKKKMGQTPGAYRNFHGETKSF